MQTFSTLQLSQTPLNTGTTSDIPIASDTFRATKRKFENDESSEKLERVKRFQKSSLLDQSALLNAQCLATPSSYDCINTITSMPTSTATTHNTTAKNDIPISFAASGEEEDCMMLEDDSNTTDDDENLKTPSHMDCSNDNNDYLQFDTGDDLEDGGYTGQLERGWHDLYSDPLQARWM
ncbi:hypothetical protein BDF20DRAFT_909561 [Mycotypha africana]|uniref:uncharacterized protein n=1 Tax=Mycotypha africana TaxID=64632 RepID=UPI0022FFC9D3|nr:uncharacterized protein BDF20DRAFT_909561 [Mycotypha africana]KAI8991837.1 hypothetical protein BDF20DRAFT_909561 [Mycotypha africana]